MILNNHLLFESAPPSEKPSAAERAVINKLTHNRGKWFIVGLSSKNDFELSYLNNVSGVLFEIGVRDISNLPQELHVFAQDICGTRPFDNSTLFVMWACRTKSAKRTNRNSPSGGNKYPKIVADFSRRLEREVQQVDPGRNDKNINRTDLWLKSISDIMDRPDVSDASLENTFDYIFGSTEKNIAADSFWSGVIKDAPGLYRNYQKILSSKTTAERVKQGREARKMANSSRPKIDRSKL